MARKLKSDKVLFLTALLLVGSSVVMVYSASAVLAMNQFNQPYFFLIKQTIWAVLGVAAMSIVMQFDYRRYREPSFVLFAIGVAAVALVAVLVLGHRVTKQFEGRRWTLPARVAARRLAALQAALPPGRWFTLDEALAAGLPAPVRKLLAGAPRVPATP